MPDEAVWTLIAIAALIFGFLFGRISKKQEFTRYAGDILVNENDNGKMVFSLELNCAPEALLEQNKVIFHIVGERK